MQAPKDQKTAQTLIRCTEEEKERWKITAEREGKGLSEWIRGMSNARSEAVLVCPHPHEERLAYPWSEACKVCGTRLRDNDTWHIPEELR